MTSLLKEAEPFTPDARQRLARDIWVTVSLLFLVSEILKPDHIYTRLLYRSIKVDLSRPVPNEEIYFPSRLTRTSDQRLRYSLPREQNSETPSLFLRSKERSSDSLRECFVEGSTVRTLVRAEALYVTRKPITIGYSTKFGLANRTFTWTRCDDWHCGNCDLKTRIKALLVP